MQVQINNFYSLKNVAFELSEGATVITGCNGAGKSQLLAALTSQAPNANLVELGFEQVGGATVQITPRPNHVFLRPALRKNGEADRGSKLIRLQNHNYRDNSGSGYVHNFDARYLRLHHRMCHLFIAGTIRDANDGDASVWNELASSFMRVFRKEIGGQYNREGEGAGVGLKLEGGRLSNFGQLSSGELEFLSLLCDLLTEPTVDLMLIDEVDLHFHPDLQAAVVNEIERLAGKRRIVVTAQSPAAMLSANPQRSYFLKHCSEVAPGENQIARLSSDIELIDKLTRIYGGFSTDAKLLRLFEDSAARQIVIYADQCLHPSPPKGSADTKESDPQIGALRQSVIRLAEGSRIVEYGVGKGRMITALKAVQKDLVATMTYVGVDLSAENQTVVTELAASLGMGLSCEFCTGPVEGQADLTLFANVIHEAGPDALPRLLTEALRNARPNSEVLILEALELAEGERGFVVLDEPAYRQLFAQCTKSGSIKLSIAQPHSYKGLPLIEVLIKVADEKRAAVGVEDVKRALQSVIDSGAQRLGQEIRRKSDLTARQLAFLAHNIANAQAYMTLL